MRSQEDVIAAVGQPRRDQFVALIQRHRDNAARHGIVELGQLALLDHAVLGHHHDELVRHELAHRQERFHGLVRLQVDQVRNMLALADGGGVRNLVDLQPVDAALVGEDQQVAVRGGDDQVLEEILGARAHADAALAAARLPPVGIHRRALQIAAVRHRDRHVFHGHQVFQADLAGVFDDLRCAARRRTPSGLPSAL